MSRLFFDLRYVIFIWFLHKIPIVVHITLLSFSGGALPPFCSRIWPSDICRQPNVLVPMIFQTNLKSKYPKYLLHRFFLWWPHICFMQVFGSGQKVSTTIKILKVFCPFCFVDNFVSELKKLPTFRRGAWGRWGSIVAMPKMRDCPYLRFQNKFVKRNLFPPFLLRPLTFRVWEAELGGNDQCSTEEGSANLSGPTRIRFRLFSFFGFISFQ